VVRRNAPEGVQVLWRRDLGGETEWYVHSREKVEGQGVNLTEIVAAFIAGEYNHGQ